MFKKTLKVLLSATMSFSIVASNVNFVNAKETIKNDETKYYESIAILGDSVCSGFTVANVSNVDNVYDIISNAEDCKFETSYPAVVAEKLGLSTTENLRNFGILGAWSKDIKDALTDPTWTYEYLSYMTLFDGSETFIVPESKVLSESQFKNAGLVKVNGEEFIQNEDGTYTIEEGTEIKAANSYSYNWGGVTYTYSYLVGYIYSYYYYVGLNALDDNACLKDNNNDGEINSYDLVGYTYGSTYDWNSWSYKAVVNEGDVEQKGEPVVNPDYTIYYHQYITENVANSDLVAVHIGGNDIIHSFLPYCQANDDPLIQLVYQLAMALMQGQNVDNILNGNILDNVSNITTDSIQEMLTYFSKDAINQLYADNGVIANYEENMDAIIQSIYGLNSDATIALISNYNPFGVENYKTMLSEALLNGELFNHLADNGKALKNLLTTIFNSSGNVNPTQVSLLESTVESELSNIMAALGEVDLSSDEYLQLLQDTVFPLAVILFGTAFADVYEDMNGILQDKAAEYNAYYIDITNAPCSSKVDPHPTNYGHEWIGNKVYDQLVPTVTTIVSEGSGIGSVSISTDKKAETTTGLLGYVTDTRLGTDITYSIKTYLGTIIADITVDGESIGKEALEQVSKTGKFVLENVTKDHTVIVKFTKHGINYFDSQLTWSDDYSEATLTYGCTGANCDETFSYTVNTTSTTIDSTCDKEGLTTYLACFKVIGLPYFTKTTTVTIDKLDHTPVIDEAISPSCTTTGLTEGSHCSVCGTVITAQEEVAMVDHKWETTYTVDKAPTNTESGSKSIHCVNCEATKDEVEIAPLFPFADVPEGKWYYSIVKEMYTLGLMTGMTGVIFSPTSNITRGQVAVILWRMSGSPEATVENPFKDVAEGKYYTEAITWCYEAGVVTGKDAAHFDPSANITRQELAAMLNRYAEKIGGLDVSNEVDLSKFADANTVSDWAKDSVKWAVANGIITGKNINGNMVIDPKANATRAECAKMLLVTYHLIND